MCKLACPALEKMCILLAYKSRKRHHFIGFPYNLSNFRGYPVISQARSMIFWNGLWFLNLLLNTFSGSTMKPYFRCNEFLTPIMELGVFLKALCGYNFCATEKIILHGLSFCLNKPLLVWGKNFINFFLGLDRLMYIHIIYARSTSQKIS